MSVFTSIRPVGWTHQIRPLAAAAICGVVGGLACLWISPAVVVTGMILAPMLLLSVRRPEVGLLGLLILTSSVVFSEQLPSVFVGFGTLWPPEIIIGAGLGLIVVRFFLDPDFELVRTPLDAPVAALLAIAFLATAVAVATGSLEMFMARRNLRSFSFYVVFFLVTNLVREPRQRRLLVNGMLGVGTLVATVMIAQAILGRDVALVPGRIETLQTQGESFAGVTRILPPGQSLLLAALVALVSVFVFERYRASSTARLVQGAVLGTGLLLTFNRSDWAAAALSLSLLALLGTSLQRRRFLAVCMVAVFLLPLFGLMLLGSPDSMVTGVAEAAWTRLSTLWEPDTIRERSLQLRYIENAHALEALREKPILGVGFGGAYRDFDPRLDRGRRSSDNPLAVRYGLAYIHNGHLAVLIRMGIVGYLVLVWLSVKFVWRGLTGWRRLPDRWSRGVVFGFASVYLAMLFASMTRPIPVEGSSIVVIAMMMGISELLIRDATRTPAAAAGR